ncbi:MAG: YegP family protein [Methanospirillaceae archaeon]|nr:YegP family protein [Methanospirillaceae archaeon]
MTGKFEVYKDKAGEFRFRLKAGNNQVILTGEGYKSKAGCMKGIESIRKNAADDSRFEVKKDKAEKFRFSLKAANGEIIGQSQGYKSENSCRNGIESVKKNAADAEIKELKE